MDFILKEASKLESELIALRRSLHKIPEIGDELPKTKRFVCEYLDKIGVPYEEVAGCDGIVATIKGHARGKTVALRADMDALHLNEDTNLPFRSEIDGQMHGCGHDAHTAMLLIVAKLLSLHTAKLNGEVKLIFQSGEETGSGAKKVIASGKIDDVDAVFGIHVGNLAGDDNNVGDIFIKEGAVSAGKDKFTITVKGKGTHSAFPERGVDPILISARIVNACEELIAREVPAGTSAVLSFGSISAGVDHNTIPSMAVIKGSIRCQDEKIRGFLGERLIELAKGIAQTFRGDAEVDLKRGSTTVMNDSDLAKFAYNAVKNVYGDSVYNNTKSALMGSDDFANYASKIPSVYFFLHTNNGENICYSNHNPKFDVDESVLIKGVVSYLAIVLNYLK